MRSIIIIVSFLLGSSGEWVEIQQLIKKPNLEVRSSLDEEELNSCQPDIHSWTSATWAKNSSDAPVLPPVGLPKTSEGKNILLNSLENNLKREIDDRVFALGERQTRTMHKGGMGSMESALITISLLTFAVYLIKLIKMIIHSVHHHKETGTNQDVVPEAGDMVQTLVVSHGRRRRSFNKHQATMQLMDVLEKFDSTDK